MEEQSSAFSKHTVHLCAQCEVNCLVQNCAIWDRTFNGFCLAGSNWLFIPQFYVGVCPCPFLLEDFATFLRKYFFNA